MEWGEKGEAYFFSLKYGTKSMAWRGMLAEEVSVYFGALKG
jgi:hypothetical protein